MPNWRRAVVPGGTFFFTVVTDQRRPVFTTPNARTILGNVIRECQQTHPFEIRALVLLPDHLHAIWCMPSGDANYSGRWQWIKTQFTQRWLAAGGTECAVTDGRKNDGRRGVWQPKFWEHTIEEEDDFQNHFDYIHYNPENMATSTARLIGHGRAFIVGLKPVCIPSVGRVEIEMKFLVSIESKIRLVSRG